MLKKLIIILVFLSYSLFYSLAFADYAKYPAPLAMVEKTSMQVLNALKQNKSRLNNKQVVFNIVNSIAVPRFDLPGISRSVVGRNYWETASTNMQQQFIKTFTRYVIDMYSSAISSYTNETINFQPLRDYDPAQNRAQIYSTIIRSSAPSVALNYRVIKNGKDWKIYDFTAEGISMVQSYRSQFSDALNRGGLTELTKRLQARK
jgi:phospholipid transport system substrate-binding protein